MPRKTHPKKKLTIELTAEQHRELVEACSWYRFSPEEFVRVQALKGLHDFTYDELIIDVLRGLQQESIRGVHPAWERYCESTAMETKEIA